VVAQSKTQPSTRRLSEVARHLVVPSGIVTTGWPAVEAKCREFGDEFDEWQCGAGKVMLGKRADGIYAATVGGITLSIPRQVAKTFLVGRIVVALCILFPGLTVLWTAHRTRTSTMTFRAMQGFVKRKKVAPYLAEGRNDGVRTANGEQEIAFRNGSIIMFGAREQGFGRGFAEVDIEVFDEAQILTEKALEDMVAATNQSRHPHGALLFFMGTPPRPVDPGEAFTLRRREALSGESEDAVYIECSADPDAKLEDRAQWAKANPSFPHRTPLRSMLRLRKNLPSDDSWRREALGIWDEESRVGSIPNWTDLKYVDGETVGIHTNTMWALAVSPISPEGQWASVGKAGRTADGFLHVECLDRRQGTRWIVPFVKQNYEANGRLPIRIHKGAPEGAFIDDLKAAGVEVDEINGVDEAHATGMLIAAAAGAETIPPTLRHLGDPFLDKAVGNAVLRSGPDGAAKWDARKSTVDISPLRAVTIALGGVPTDPTFDGPVFVNLGDYLEED
jgi:phage terminase large subunit-like protein